MIEHAIHRLCSAIRKAHHIVVLTGAGISAESGVPTFRDTQTGLWANYRPEDLATPEAFERDPQTVWQWYQWRRELLARVKPNAGHFALAQLANIVPALTLITQNVDGLHQQAGSSDIIEFHGNIRTTICTNLGCTGGWDTEDKREPPHCSHCGSKLRPGVVWFGESIPPTAMQASKDAIATCDLFIAIGTSALVQPAASLAQEARYNHATIAEINPNATPLSSSANIVIAAPSGEALPAILKQLGWL